MKALVTGADGFIGSHLCEALRDAGHRVTGLALYNSFDSHGWLDEVSGVEKVRGDVRDADQMRALMDGQDAVFHLAALISVPDSYVRPRSYLETNATGTLNILTAARDVGARVIHTSTSEVYGTAKTIPMDESHPIAPQSPYAASKAAADALAWSFHLSYNMPVTILRPFNTYGPRQLERAVIPSLIRQHLDLACTKIKIGNPTARRDFLYVTDTCRAFLAVLDAPPGVYNAATDAGYKISDVLDRIRFKTGSIKPVETDGSRWRPHASEVAHLRGSGVALYRATGWHATVPLDTGLNWTIDWWRGRAFRKDLANVA